MVNFIFVQTKTKKGIMQQDFEKDKLYKTIRYAIVILLVVFILLPFVSVILGFLRWFYWKHNTNYDDFLTIRW